MLVAFCLAAGATSIGAYYLLSWYHGTRLINDGYAAAFRNDSDTAIKRFNEALKQHLTQQQALFVHMNRGLVYNSKSRFDEAIRDFTEALRVDPKIADAYAGRGFAYQCRGDAPKAIVDLTEAIRRDPNSPSAFYNRGIIFFQKGEIDRAIADLDEAVRCNPNSADALVWRGLCYAAKNDLDRALANFDGAIAVDPNNASAFMERSNIYLGKGDHEKQARDYDQARRLTPNIGRTPEESWIKDHHDVFRDAQSAYQAGDFDRAIELNNKLLAMEINVAQASSAVMNRGNAYKAKGNTDRALADYDQALRLDPSNAGAYVDRGLVLAEQGDRDGA
ncbi:MAG: hypothetical protein QOI22_1136, partial [Verrucomicrobiota bacterium]